MSEKVDVYCFSCDANYIITHDLQLPYILHYCPFCGDEIESGGLESEEMEEKYNNEEDEWYGNY